ncbi:CAMK family protein kinase [Tritrichomonas foetus]|uniref:non-specific serine/threonine protein kinase n=1 Tax=Tritrichomonas foetus TaxID=1144522 RepID=A0A1J4JPS8_9EUKA|nr:CAMK family protein kinase [Tritrichomonas foetus]|eukprot:OHT01043.1 CAMK family protein kinase [Tritrichomonas foetus]
MRKSRSTNSNSSNSQGMQYGIDDYHVIAQEKIAEGGFGTIFKCIDTSNQPHVLKLLQTPENEYRQRVMTEICIQKQLSNHRNIVKLEGFFEGDRSFRILLEFCEDNLVNEMNRFISKGFNTEKIAEIFSSVLSAVKYMHEQNPPIIHRDLKPENVLYRKGVWKLCDFGSATTKVYQNKNESERMQANDDISRNTTPSYRSPEMVDLFRGQKIDLKSDVWALGCLLYKICTFKDAFADGTNLQILNGKYSWNQAWEVDDYLKKCVDRCLQPNPDDRPTVSELEEDFRSHFGKSEVQPITVPKMRINTGSNVDVESYTKLLLLTKPPEIEESDQISDESDIELIEETKMPVLHKSFNSQEFNQYQFEEDQNEMPMERRPSVIELETTIETLIEFGDNNKESQDLQNGRINSDLELISSSIFNSNQTLSQNNSSNSNNSLNSLNNKNSENVSESSSSNNNNLNNTNSNTNKSDNLNQELSSDIDSQTPKVEKKPEEDFMDLFINKSNGPDYQDMMKNDPKKLKESLMKMDNLSLSTALYRIMVNNTASEFILGFARESGSFGTKIFSHLPALSNTPLNNYLELRKSFCNSYPMFEGNFSLFEFTQVHKNSPPPPGNPPVSLDVVKMLQKLLDYFLKAFRSSPSRLLAEDGYDTYQVSSYLIAKLKQFKLQPGFVETTTIPLYKNLHMLILKEFEKSGLNIPFPKEPFNFDDPVILKRLRAPQHKDSLQNVASS